MILESQIVGATDLPSYHPCNLHREEQYRDIPNYDNDADEENKSAYHLIFAQYSSPPN
jgi:hypothetical protein